MLKTDLLQIEVYSLRSDPPHHLLLLNYDSFPTSFPTNSFNKSIFAYLRATTNLQQICLTHNKPYKNNFVRETDLLQVDFFKNVTRNLFVRALAAGTYRYGHPAPPPTFMSATIRCGFFCLPYLPILTFFP